MECTLYEYRSFCYSLLKATAKSTGIPRQDKGTNEHVVLDLGVEDKIGKSESHLHPGVRIEKQRE